MKHLALTLPDGTVISGPAGVPTGGFTNSTTGNDIVSGVFGLTLTIAAVLTLMYLLYGAFQWITSGGDKEKLAASRKRITYAIIGLLVVFFSALIINLLLSFLGLPTLGGMGGLGSPDDQSGGVIF